MSEVVFKSYNIAVLQSSVSDLIHLYSCKLELHGVFEGLVKISNSISVFYIKELICRPNQYKSVLVSLVDHVFALITYLN